MPKESPRTYQKRLTKDEREMEFLFVEINSETAICVICGKIGSPRRVYNISRHYFLCHQKEYQKLTRAERHQLIIDFRKGYNPSDTVECSDPVECADPLAICSDPLSSCSSDIIKVVNPRESLAASYVVSLEIARANKCFSEAEFIKKCCIAMAQQFNNDTAVKEFESVPLSRKTVSTRIAEMDVHIEKKLQNLIDSCAFFSLRLDESVDGTDTSQLLIFIRTIQHDFSIHEELLSLVSLKRLTKGVDMFDAVTGEVNNHTTFDKCSGIIITEGAPCTNETENDFDELLKQNSINCPIFHCIVHQKLLCAKSLKLGAVMKIVIVVTNFIRKSNCLVNHKKIKLFSDEVNVVYGDFMEHSQIRWLNAGQCLLRFFKIRKYIINFLDQEKDPKITNIKKTLQTKEFLGPFAFLTDIATHFDELNLRLQAKNQNVISLFGHINGFRKFMKLFAIQLEKEDLFHFRCCAEIKAEFPDLKFSPFKEHLTGIINDFDKRFKDFDNFASDVNLYLFPLTGDIHAQRADLQFELCQLQSDPVLILREETGEDFFKMLSKEKYPKLQAFGLKLCSLLGTTSICENTYSIMKLIKSDRRASLSDDTLLHLVRLSTTKLSIDIPTLVAEATSANKSH